MTRKDRRPRAQDVAAAAGVSTATVSRAFNSPDQVSPEVRARVLSVAASLGWIPHAAGSALARRYTAIAGVVIPTLGQEIFALQVAGMQAAFSEHDITLLIGCSNYDPEQGAAQVKAMLARGVEALAIVGENQEAGFFDMLDARRVPYVVLYGLNPDTPHPSVGFDNHEAYTRITHHLLGLGHDLFGAILQPMVDNDRATARLAGVRDALSEHGLGLKPLFTHIGPTTIEFGRASLRAIFSSPPPHPTAIICGNDTLALGALMEAKQLGLRVPDDLSVTGFDDIELAAEFDPPLTTLRVDNIEIGRLAAAQLIARLNGEEAPVKVAVEPVFVERGTTAAPNRNRRRLDPPPR
ncbi:substrate-binding domain-containing protein [Xanthobacteraceae bacterium Astr-EGSB]|uniref:LacI family DNA-binding transcriptional regulator n=1 Tax=Astrobacterium formosum TaxID=3069710 RepID=UPI0027B4CCEB|nr:substrate-binding domain-containing protein [Xanthobacteraceae bacterium Astr-EGSB]